MNNSISKSLAKEYKTWGRSRSNRLGGYDYSVDLPIHVTICTNEKNALFDPGIKADTVIEELLKTAQDLKYRILCYCLMPEHLHVIFAPGDSGISLSKFLNIFKGRTTALFRKQFDIHVIWQRSAYDRVIRAGDDLKAIIEYILYNPVRKGIVTRAEDYPNAKWFEDVTKLYL